LGKRKKKQILNGVQTLKSQFFDFQKFSKIYISKYNISKRRQKKLIGGQKRANDFSFQILKIRFSEPSFFELLMDVCLSPVGCWPTVLLGSYSPLSVWRRCQVYKMEILIANTAHREGAREFIIWIPFCNREKEDFKNGKCSRIT